MRQWRSSDASAGILRLLQLQGFHHQKSSFLHMHTGVTELRDTTDGSVLFPDRRSCQCDRDPVGWPSRRFGSAHTLFISQTDILLGTVLHVVFRSHRTPFLEVIPWQRSQFKRTCLCNACTHVGSDDM